MHQQYQELLDEPFGPYRDQDTLSPDCKSVRRSVLELHNVMLEYAGRATGLDETEPTPIRALHLSRRSPLDSSVPVRFRGVLTLSSVKQLAPTGIRNINMDLALRHTRATLPGSPHTVDWFFSQLEKAKANSVDDSEELPTVRVLIQGVKFMTVGYLTSTLIPNGLMLTSVDQKRHYEVLSMQIQTYELSRTYLFRYHTHRAMRIIIDKEKESSTPEDRTPAWFVSKYLRHYSYLPEHRWIRPVYYQYASETDASADGHEDWDQPPPDLADDVGRRTHRPRHLRHVHTAEVYSVFASHVEWIIAEQGQQRKTKVINMDAWREWAQEVRIQRKHAMVNGVRWGVQDEHDGEGQFGEVEDAEPVSAPIQIRPPRSKSAGSSAGRTKQSRKIRKIVDSDAESTMDAGQEPPVRHSKRRPLSARTSATRARGKSKGIWAKKAPSPTPRHLSHTPVLEDDALQNKYDSDFSTSSTPPASRSPSPDMYPPVDPELIALIPEEFYHPPRVGGDMKWECPVAGCHYMVDLLNLTGEHQMMLRQQGVTQHEVAFLQNKEWVLGSERVIHRLYDIVSLHWEQHLKDRGIRVSRIRDGRRYSGKFEWERPEVRRPWPPPEYVRDTQERRVPEPR